MSAAKKKKSFDYAAEAKRNHEQFLQILEASLPQMSKQQLCDYIKDLVEAK